MPIEIVYFVHATTVDNENDIGSGQASTKLSEKGLKQAKSLNSKTDKTFDILFCSDLNRAVESAELSFGDECEIIKDERLRECDYGDMNGQILDWSLKEYIDTSYPGGESYRDVEKRVSSFLEMLRDNYTEKDIAIMAHQGPQLALEVISKSMSWEEAIDSDWRNNDEWQPGWIYTV